MAQGIITIFATCSACHFTRTVLEAIMHGFASMNIEHGRRRFEWMLLVSILLLALILRLYQLGEQSLWWDEAQSWWFASHSISELIPIIIENDQHPPLYYILMSAWLKVDTSEWWMRFLSVIFSISAIPFVFAIGRMHSFTTGMIASGIIACSPIQIQYAQEARMYAMMFFFAALVMWSVAKFITDERPNVRVQVTYVIGSVGALYSHNTGIFLVFSALLVLAWNFRHEKTRLLLVASLTAVVILSWLPWIPSLMGQIRETGEHFWIPPLQPGGILQAIEQIVTPFHYHQAIAVRILLVIVIVAIALTGVRAVRNDRRLSVFTIAFIAIPFLSMTFISVWRPILLPKTVLWMMLPLSILIGAAISSMKRRFTAIAAGALIVLIAISGGFYYFGSVQKEDWRSAAKMVHTLAQQSVFPLYTSPLSEIPLQYYWHGLGVEVEGWGIPARLFERGWEPIFTSRDEAQVRHLAESERALALVVSHSWISDQRGRIPEIIEETHARHREYTYYGIRIIHYRR